MDNAVSTISQELAFAYTVRDVVHSFAIKDVLRP